MSWLRADPRRAPRDETSTGKENSMTRLTALSTVALLAQLGAVAALSAQHLHHGAGAPASANAPAARRNAAPDLPSTPLPARIVHGAPVALGNGTARTLVAYDVDGAPRTVGVSLSPGALDGLEKEPPADDTGWLYRLPLPQGVALPPYDHVGLYWNPRGHEPNGVYTVAHFDVHFFMSAPAALDLITVVDRDLERAYRLPPASAIPPGYVLPPNTQHRRMGVHWVDTGAAELHGEPFEATFIIGSYDEEVNFLEPMITHAFLASRPDLTRAVPQPEAWARDGWYPATWSVRWDEQRGEYLVLLDELRWQKAATSAGTLAATPVEGAASSR
jgi:hypothetical protein